MKLLRLPHPGILLAPLISLSVLVFVIGYRWLSKSDAADDPTRAINDVVTVERLAAQTGDVQAYVTSAGMVDFLVRHHGQDALRELPIEVGRGGDLDDALKVATGIYGK